MAPKMSKFSTAASSSSAGDGDWYTWKNDHFDYKGLDKDTVEQVAKKVKTQIEGEDSKTPCFSCGRADLRKTDLLHLSPFNVQTFSKIHAACFECVQCEMDDQAWNWLQEDIDDRTYDWRKQQPVYLAVEDVTNPAPGSEPSDRLRRGDDHIRRAFLPVASFSNPEDTNKPLQVIRQIHQVQYEGNQARVTRKPMFTDPDRDTNKKAFQRAARRSWVQWGIANKGYYEATARNLDYRTLADKTRAQIEQEFPGTKISQRIIRNAMLKDCTNIAEAIALSILTGPKRERQVEALRNFDRNMAERSEDVNYKIRALVQTFEGNRFAEYLDTVVAGHNQHFLCRSQKCRSFFPSDCWIQGFNHNGTETEPNLWQFLAQCAGSGTRP
jgi:hypothetical protein